MRANVDQYIRNCHVCRRSKIFKNDQHDQLQSIFVKKKSWQNISLNFVTDLSKNKNCNIVFMIVNWFFKMRHYIACRAAKKISASKKQSNCSFKMFENCMNCLKQLYRTKIFNSFFWRDEFCVKFWTSKSNCQQYFILKLMIKTKFIIRKWNNICALT